MDAHSLDQIRQVVADATQGLRQDIAASAATLRQEMAASTTELRQEIAASATTLRDDLSEVKRHTGVLVEDLHHKLDLVIEGHQLLRQQIAESRSENERQARETRALIQLSYHQLQERVESLERRVETIEQRLGFSM